MASNFFKHVAAVLCAAVALGARADMLELINGDHYRGTVVSMDAANVVFQSEIQGRVVLPRGKVAVVTLNAVGAKPVATASPAIPPASLPAVAPKTNVTGLVPGNHGNAVVEELRKQGVDSHLIDQVQQQIFGKASPEAAQKFDQIMGGLMTGRLSVDDIRKEAQSSINQIKVAKKELGPDAGEMLDSYLSILEKFMQESGSETTPPASPAK